MNRRQFVSNLVGATGSLAYARARREGKQIPAPAPDASIRRVLVIFKCHLDLGFVDTQAAVVNKYFKQYFPHAMQIATAMRESGEERYVWTTGSWLVFEYLEQANAQERKQMEQAIERGDIAWHALPFSWQTELLDRSAIAGTIGLSKSLDRRFGRITTGAKMTDVPGHSRGLIGPLAENGVTFLDIGVNSASTPPDVPAVFVWKNPDGASLTMLYHRHRYGGVEVIPGSDLAVAVEVRNDNSGPHTVEEIRKIYSGLRQQFPNAAIRASNLTEVANAVKPYESKLPVVTQEIGDTWIYGVASDPIKVARYREMLRLRNEWIEQGKFAVADAVDLALLRRLALAAEHTWGTDTKTWLDFDHYTPDALARMLDQPHYKTVTKKLGGETSRYQTKELTLFHRRLRAQANERLAKLKPVRPDTSALKMHNASEPIEATHFTIGLDPATGAIVRLRDKRNNREWASADHPLALFSYQTLSKKDYDEFLASYITVQTDWAPKDFGKPNIEKFGAQSRIWTPKLTQCFSAENNAEHRIVARLQIEEAGGPKAVTAWPREMFLDVVLPKSEPIIQLNFSWFGKRANRLPEAIWLSFHPDAPETHNWILSKVDQPVSPMDVVPGGNRHMHALSRGINYQDARGKLVIETLDAPLVALGHESPIYFSNSQPEMSNGIHFSVFNNGWGTNYIQWFGEDVQFRFLLRPS